MKTAKEIWPILVLTMIFATAATLQVRADNALPADAYRPVLTERNQNPAVPDIPALLSRAQKAWEGALEWCESQGDPKAINHKDRDGTPSYGLLQFKPGTYAGFAKLYGLASTTDYMNPDGQRAIVEQMIHRGDVDMTGQFPGCTAKIGLPPVTTVDNE